MITRKEFSRPVEVGIYSIYDTEENELEYTAELDADGDWHITITSHVLANEEAQVIKNLLKVDVTEEESK